MNIKQKNTNKLIGRIRALLEKLIVTQLVNKFPTFVGLEIHNRVQKRKPLDCILSHKYFRTSVD
jgi:hypothetical protein